MLWNTVLLALREIRRNVMRSFLTILGIVIGVGAVITMVTIGGGATLQVKQQISSMGSNMLMVSPGKRLGPGQSSGNVPFKEADAEAISREVGSIAAVAPVSSQSSQAIFGNQNWTTQVTGSNNQYFYVTNRTVAAGRQFSESELRAGAAVCIIGETVRKKLFGGQDALGEKIRLQKLSCEVIGLLEGKGQSSMGMDQDDVVVIPLRTLQRRVTGKQDIGMIQVSVQQGASTDKALKDIAKLMRERRHLAPSDDDNFNVMDMKEISKMLTGTTELLTALLSAVAAVSLLVGGIGIMNIMLVSVTERTREIGVRLAIGAMEREVLMQFLVEAVVLSSLGGIIGIMLALAASIWLAGLLRVPFVFNGPIVFVAFLFSAAVGMIFGYFPALKAARLDPIEALRHE
ncbi:MAG TPA: ABC transporter permease [Syntrophorhabdaceae bacterium]|nr:ABC transporter permease [Syntrophorhabdaceae bacterium]HQM81341.1 ABC transporter permease [Syntrophorhabdaceae bacterium]